MARRMNKADREFKEMMVMFVVPFALGVVTSIAATAIYNMATTGTLSLKLPFLSPS